MEGVEAGPEVAAEEFRLREAEIDLLAQRPPLDPGDDILAAAAEVALGDAQVDHEGVDRAEAGADGQFAGRLFLHGDVDDRAVGRRAARFLDGHVLEEAETAEVIARPLQQGAVEGVALGQHHLTADDVVERAGVADDVDAVHVDPLALANIEGDVDGVGLGVRPIRRLDLDEGVAGRARREGQGVHRRLDLVALVELARADGQQQLEEVRVQPVVLGDHLDRAEIVAVALVDGDGDAEGAVVRGQFGDRRQDAEVVVAAVGVEFPQLFPVVVETVGVVVVVGAEELPPLRPLGDHHLLQVAVREGRVAEEGDGAHAGFRALVDLEDDVDAVLVQLDQLGRDGGRDTAGQAVQLDDLADVLLHPGAGVDAARTQGHFLAQLGLGDGAVPLEHDLVDDRVLDDLDDQVPVRLNAKLDVSEQLGAGQGANRHVQNRVIDRVARLDRQIGQDGGLVDALVAAHQDAVDHQPLLRRRLLRRGRILDHHGRFRRLGQGRATQAGRDGEGQQARAQAAGETKGGRVLSDHAGNHRGLASARHASPPRKVNRPFFCRSFQVANNINPASKARPTRYPTS